MYLLNVSVSIQEETQTNFVSMNWFLKVGMQNANDNDFFASVRAFAIEAPHARHKRSRLVVKVAARHKRPCSRSAVRHKRPRASY